MRKRNNRPRLLFEQIRYFKDNTPNKINSQSHILKA